jgi:hypothetical protein
MTSIAVTASICANASEAALLVASFMPFSLDLGMTHRCARARATVKFVTRNTPRRVYALTSPHSANIDNDKVDQQYGGILARAQPVCARVMEFSKRISSAKRDRAQCGLLLRNHQPDTVSEEAFQKSNPQQH